MTLLRSISLRLTFFVSLAVVAGGVLTWPFWVWFNYLIELLGACRPKRIRT